MILHGITNCLVWLNAFLPHNFLYYLCLDISEASVNQLLFRYNFC